MQIVFPEGKEKALTFSYDDGQLYDRKLVQILKKYGMKGTFHLNSNTIGTEGYITEAEVAQLYSGMEVAAHTLDHPYLLQQSQASILRQTWEDKKRLEKLSGRIVRGFSYPFGEVSDQLQQTLKCQGVEYARTVESTGGFQWPDNFLQWNPTCHHNEVSDSLIEHFLYPQAYEKNLLLFIWGHSFEFHRENTWDRFEKICSMLADKQDVWYATNEELKDYITAVRNLSVSADEDLAFNSSSTVVYIKKGECLIKIMPGVLQKI